MIRLVGSLGRDCGAAVTERRRFQDACAKVVTQLSDRSVQRQRSRFGVATGGLRAVGGEFPRGSGKIGLERGICVHSRQRGGGGDATPSAGSKIIDARHTCFWAALRSLITRSSRSRSVVETSNLIPLRMMLNRMPRPQWESQKGLVCQALSTGVQSLTLGIRRDTGGIAGLSMARARSGRGAQYGVRQQRQRAPTLAAVARRAAAAGLPTKSRWATPAK